MMDLPPIQVFHKSPNEACQAAADYWAAKAKSCEESARLAREHADQQENEAELYRHIEQQWRDSKAAIDTLFESEST